jgi:hypothetical protein
MDADSRFHPGIWALDDFDTARTTNSFEYFTHISKKHFHRIIQTYFCTVNGLFEIQKDVYVKICSTAAPHVKKQTEESSFYTQRCYDMCHCIVVCHMTFSALICSNVSLSLDGGFEVFMGISDTTF